MPKFVEMGQAVTLGDQLKSEEGPVILINTFVTSPDDADKLLEVWTGDASLMKAQPGFISTQLHRGIAGSGVFLNYAIWQSVAHFRSAFTNPAFQAKLADYPEGVTVSPHLFRKVEVPGICTA
ncbi:antibiotic biosynthesis monooxygenase family protein [Methylobacterium sp. J-076]|uniref:antibiotic biosynthesis monooxygenase family protein n=1 Tax=Methylobacterium sp. J-076 TaxID=2836655 RepID=UPI001FBA7B73|nr:antibiotic biosynthesis monooxygenase family protein [Methylobacterium sp. J-076]MCJ2011892.1 antibiotic biosynthesis monooxygenase [Methylobacterium sp. J-076]